MNKGMLLAALLCAVSPAWAEETEAERADRWATLQSALFGKTAGDAGPLLSIDAPVRALDAALVPIKVEIAPGAHVKSLWLIVDGNPSPRAGTFHFGDAADARTLRTRVRVDQYTTIHAVAEMADGRLLATGRFIKASGGCSAPSTKDAALAESRIGQMRMRFPEADAGDGSVTAELLISHPNANGMQVDQVTHNFIPARYIQDVTVMDGAKLVFSLEADISLSEDPSITFAFVPEAGNAPLSVKVRDSSDAVFERSFEVPERKS